MNKTQLETLQTDIQEGFNSGLAEPLDINEIKEEGKRKKLQDKVSLKNILNTPGQCPCEAYSVSEITEIAEENERLREENQQLAAHIQQQNHIIINLHKEISEQ